MNIATILFTYNRSYHTKKTLEALENNTQLPEKLFIFQDGAKENEDTEEWQKVNAIIKDISWCDIEVNVSDINKGLKNSIIDGINYVFRFYDAVIVLEDDCVAHPMFMEYMNTALNKYYDNKQVYSISGHNIPSDFCENGTDAYFSGRIESWGWGTWKDRWKKMKEDYGMLARIKKDDEAYKRFLIWGADFEAYLLGNIEGTCNSWATFWGMTVIENNGVCLQPYKALINQIGIDGSGTNSGRGDFYQKLRDLKDLRKIVLPDEIEITRDTEEKYQEYYHWTLPEKRRAIYNDILIEWIQMIKSNNSIKNYLEFIGIERIAIYGKGSLCDLLIDEFNNNIEITAVVVTEPFDNMYKGISVVDIKNVPDNTQLIIIVPIYDYEIITRRIRRVSQCRTIGIDELIEAAIDM